jgi:hypothetical protein
MLELYVYYRAAPADEAALRDAWHALCGDLSTRLHGLDGRLLQRADEVPPTSKAPSAITWMEIYRRPPHGLDAAAIDTIETCARATLGSWIDGPRHREVFRVAS